MITRAPPGKKLPHEPADGDMQLLLAAQGRAGAWRLGGLAASSSSWGGGSKDLAAWLAETNLNWWARWQGS
jgi:hypothetical protein